MRANKIKSIYCIIEKLLLLLLSGIILFSCAKEPKQEEKKPKAKKPLVKIEVLELSSISKSVKLTGTVEAKIVTNILAPIDGYVEKLNVRENQFVNKDKELAILGSQERVSLISMKKNELEQLEAKIQETPSDSGEYPVLIQKLEKVKNEFEYAKKLFLGVPVMSPLSGVITQKLIEKGSGVSAKQILLTITDFNSLIIKSSVSEDLFNKIKLGDKLRVIFNTMPDNEFIARVSLKYKEIDPVTRNLQIECKIIGNNRQIIPGMMAELEFVSEKADNTIIVPNDVFIVNQQGEKVVYVVKDSTAHQIIVTTGISNENVTEVTYGLKEGDKLVVLGQELLADGINVNIQKSEGNTSEGEKK